MDKASERMDESFVELSPRERLAALLDEGLTELCDPFCRLGSPWLKMQGLVAQADDGVVVVRGTIDGEAVVAVAIEPAFEGGSIGEVGGAKIATALELAAEDCRAGRPTAALLLLESGGVRLGEANLGLAAIAAIQTAIIALRDLAPVIAVIAGPTGCFGGMSLAASLCTHIIGTAYGRLGMNGPEVIEQEAGPDELDATNRGEIWRMVGCEARVRDGFVDTLASDSAVAIQRAIREALRRGVHPTERIAGAAARLRDLRLGFAEADTGTSVAVEGRGSRWMDVLSSSPAQAVEDTPSVLSAEGDVGGERALFLAVVPDAQSRLPRASHGEMGLEQAWALAACIRAWVDKQAHAPIKQTIVAIVDTPGQAFGRREEERCISAACAAAVDAYAAARRAGHPVLTLVVGRAISGSFLAHGMQSDTILALDSPGVVMHAMSRESIARITRRSMAEVQAASDAVPPMSYSIEQAHALGVIHTIVPGVNADAPTSLDREIVQSALATALKEVCSADRIERLEGNSYRGATIAVRRTMRAQWEALSLQANERGRVLDAIHQ